RMGVLMASIRTGNALHPTNLHVNKQLYPKDRVQDRVPEPGWMEHWLNEQIRFDREWQEQVIGRILQNLSLILKTKFESVRDLQQYRKQLANAAA
ncbi:MAG TPA: ferritin-like domain-containing protein, partial [Gammaproteobacteria bacterium]|nr:ferritin-like domain-containing protein [Gammaproteobacteria bacterium]